MFHISLSKFGYDINYHKKPQNSYFIQFYYHILFKAQEYLCLAIFEKPMIQIHGKTILSMEFKSMTKAHDLNPWQHQNPIFIGNIKAQFSLAISKAQLALALLKAQANYLTLFYQKPKVIKYLAKYYIIIISLKSPIINNTLNS